MHYKSIDWSAKVIRKWYENYVQIILCSLNFINVIDLFTCFSRANFIRQYTVHAEFQLFGTSAVYDASIKAVHSLLFYGFRFVENTYDVVSYAREKTRKHARARSFCVFIFHVFHFHLEHDECSPIVFVTQWISSTFTAIHFTLSSWDYHCLNVRYIVVQNVTSIESKFEPKIWIISSIGVITNTESIFQCTVEQYKSDWVHETMPSWEIFG